MADDGKTLGKTFVRLIQHKGKVVLQKAVLRSCLELKRRRKR